jgi:hypothetical protein
MHTKKLSVVKVPNEAINETENVEEFPRMPRMYLELLENKDKVKPELVNKEYDPDDAESIISFYSSKNDKNVSKLDPRMPTLEENNVFQRNNFQDNDDEDDDEDIVDDDDNDDFKSNDDDDDEDDDNDNDDDDDDLKSFVKEDISLSQSSNSLRSNNDNKDNINFLQNNVFNNNEEDFNDNDEVFSHKSFVSEKNDTRDKLKEILKNEGNRPSPPKLSDLEHAGMLKTNKVIPNLDHIEVQEEEDEEDKKRELLFKFELLKKSYKNVNLPEFTIHSSLKKMNEAYENQLRHLTLDSSVESYKNILVGGFMIFEFIFGVWFKFDMSGFTQQQILNMNQYERLLIELGQKSYVPEGQQWPVEVRLIGLIVLNAVIFIISKMILKKTGNNLMGMMNHVQSSSPGKPNPSPERQEPKKKMKGPSINIDEL